MTVQVDKASKQPVRALGSKERRRRESDDRMIRAAIRLIGRHGIAGTSVADIGVEAGYSRGLPVQRFGTKLHLLTAVIDTIEENFSRKVAQKTIGLQGVAALCERIRTHMELVSKEPAAATALYCLVIDSMTLMPELRPRIMELQVSNYESLLAHVREARSLGEIGRDVDIEHSTRAIAAILSGMTMQALVQGSTALLPGQAKNVTRIVLGELALERSAQARTVQRRSQVKVRA